MLNSVLAISFGAAAGAVLRWFFSLAFNSIWSVMPLGTLAANWIGGYLIGLSVSYFDAHMQLSPEWRLLVITGFLGGLTTFSTFSAEVVAVLQAGDYFKATTTIVMHLLGSVLLTIAGIATYQVFK
jgi:CrcB protein